MLILFELVASMTWAETTGCHFPFNSTCALLTTVLSASWVVWVEVRFASPYSAVAFAPVGVVTSTGLATAS